MPENDVTVDADFEFMLEKDSYDNYIVSTDEELLILSKAVNDGMRQETSFSQQMLQPQRKTVLNRQVQMTIRIKVILTVKVTL